MLWMIDNYDSFTYNLVQYLQTLGAEVKVVRNDAMSVDEIAAQKPERIVISPGPCTPNEAGVSLELIQRLGPTTPILGVCLGHQGIGQVYGGTVIRAGNIMHGKTSPIRHEGKGVFAGLPDRYQATRYHSLVVDKNSLPDVLEVTLVEHKPFARWGNDRLVSEQGKLFPTPKKLSDLALPELDGPDSQTEEVMKLYSDSRALFAPAGVDVRRVTMDARGSWSLVLSNGTEVVVGRDDARSRLQRFVKVLPQLNRQDAPIERADLRYTNGFTLSWGTPATPAKTPATPASRTQERT